MLDRPVVIFLRPANGCVAFHRPTFIPTDPLSEDVFGPTTRLPPRDLVARHVPQLPARVPPPPPSPPPPAPPQDPFSADPFPFSRKRNGHSTPPVFNQCDHPPTTSQPAIKSLVKATTKAKVDEFAKQCKECKFSTAVGLTKALEEKKKHDLPIVAHLEKRTLAQLEKVVKHEDMKVLAAAVVSEALKMSKDNPAEEI